MLELRAACGLPGSGKTTEGRRWVSADPDHRAYVDRDSLRAMLHDGRFVADITEPVIVAAETALIRALLARGISVFCGDTNFPEPVMAMWVELAAEAGAVFTVADLRDVPLLVCIGRDAKRPCPGGGLRSAGEGSQVGEAVIRRYHTQYIEGRSPVMAS